MFNKRYHPAGTAPGTLTKKSAEGAPPLRIQLVDYDADSITVLDDIDAESCGTYLQRPTVTWVHIAGNPTVAALKHLGEAFGLHSLALEDVVNSGQRPKAEPFPDHLFIVMSLPSMVDGEVEVHQVSLFAGDRFLISFCESETMPFESVVNRLQVTGARIRGQGADYLLYSLLDLVIDKAFPLLETFGMQLEGLEEDILESANRETLGDIHRVRRELILLRRTLWPQREVINALLRDESAIIGRNTHLYLRDCYDHTVQIIDLLETYRDMVASMLEMYLSMVSNRMNEVMRVLTVIATIFIPLTFIVGVYGMNFDPDAGPLSMPELGQPLGYVFVWFAILLVAAGMVLFFRGRDWF